MKKIEVQLQYASSGQRLVFIVDPQVSIIMEQGAWSSMTELRLMFDRMFPDEQRQWLRDYLERRFKP